MAAVYMRVNSLFNSKKITNNLVKHLIDSALTNPFLRCYCSKVEELPNGRKVPLYYKMKSIEFGELRRKQMGIEPKKPRDKIEYEEAKVDWKYVTRLIPSPTVPDFPKFAKYPSGWQPPDFEKTKDLPYHIRRTRTRDVPVYFEVRNGLTRQITTLRLIEGDIWALADELKQHLENLSGVEVPIQIHEVACFIRFRGDYFREISFWLMDKGF